MAASPRKMWLVPSGLRQPILHQDPGVPAWLSRFCIVPALSLLNRLAADTACRVGGSLGVLVFHLGLRRRTAGQQLGLMMGLKGTRRRDILRRAYATMGANFVELLAVGGPDGPEHHFEVRNPTWLAQTLARHPRALFLAGHLGSWDIGAHTVTRITGRVVVYAKPQHDPEIDALANRQRARLNLHVVFTGTDDKSAALEATRAMRTGIPLALMADQRPHHRDGAPAWWFDQPAWVLPGPAFFCHRMKAAVIPGVCLRYRAGRMAAVVGRPFQAEGRDQAVLVQRGADLLAAMIAAHPGQYFWHHRRIGGQPPAPVAPRSDSPWRRGMRLLAERW